VNERDPDVGYLPRQFPNITLLANVVDLVITNGVGIVLPEVTKQRSREFPVAERHAMSNHPGRDGEFT
jgi:hypothetical protein